MYKRILLVSLSVLMGWIAYPAASTVCDAAQIQGGVQDTYAVNSIESLTLRNQRTGKNLLARVTFPVGCADPCPVIIFSHGAGGSKDAYQYVINYWAAHGYVCVQPNHGDSINLADGKSAMAFSMMKTIKTLPSDYQLWASRFADISCIIDSLPIIQQQIPTRMDQNEIACGGHSLGAFTTAVIGGATVPQASRTSGSLQDARVKVLLMMSPQGLRHCAKDFGFDDKNSWTNIHLPSLFITGTEDGTQWTPAAQRRISYDCSPPGNKFLAIIEGASHMTFAGVNLNRSALNSGRPRPLRDLLVRRMREKLPSETGNHVDMLQDIQVVTTTFLDAYLKNNQADRRELCQQPEVFGPLVAIECK